MKNKDNRLLAGLAAAGTIVLGAAIYFGPINTEPADISVNHCHDGIEAIYTVDGQLFGDQNQDGQLSGDECDWK